MDRVRNPYSPGAGTPPPALAGRSKQIEDMDVALRRRLVGRPAKSMMLTGLRGVGKTVLLAEFSRLALGSGYVHEHIEADEGTDLRFRIAVALHRTLMALSPRRAIAEGVARALGVLKGFTLRLPNGIDVGLDIAPILGAADSGALDADLAALLCEVGEVAKAGHAGVLLTVDEIQYLAPDQLGALIMGLHRVDQLLLPLVVAGAGLPSIRALSGEAKSYAERMFLFPEIGPLGPADAAMAITQPALDEGVRWHEDAVQLITTLTQGYPYFLQEFGKQAWDVAQSDVEIGRGDVESSVAVTLTELDTGFFRVRFDRTTDAERGYLRAMASLGSGPHSSAAVAARLGKRTAQVGPVRDSLIKRGLCYAPRWGEIAFTVPMFDGFMLRCMS